MGEAFDFDNFLLIEYDTPSIMRHSDLNQIPTHSTIHTGSSSSRLAHKKVGSGECTLVAD